MGTAPETDSLFLTIEGHDYLRIPMGSLCVDDVTGFDLYLPQAGNEFPVLYRAADLPFDAATRERLHEFNVKQLLVPRDHHDAYKLYVERNLSRIVSDTAVPLEERSEALYFSAKELVNELMNDPRAGEMKKRSAAVVNATTSILYNEKHALRQLMRVSSYDYYTYTHSVNVFVFSTALVLRRGHPRHIVEEFGQGALLHDVGKSRIDRAIVNCKGQLNDAQWLEMKRHTIYGWEILREQGITSEIALDVTRHHHEKLNGMGYPDGLKGNHVSEWARIATVADIFDALTTRRSYKTAMESFPGLQFMAQHMRDEIDMDIYKMFVAMMANP